MPVSHASDAVSDTAPILLVSCYELGHQPLAVAVAAGRFAAARHKVRVIDLAVEALDTHAVRSARFVAFSAPMHTALRIGIEAARRVRHINPRCHIAFYGIYAALNSDYLLGGAADSCLGAESEDALVELALRVVQDRTPVGEGGPHPDAELQSARRRRSAVPDRSGLPGLDRYVHLVQSGERHAVGQVMTTRGCKHLCRHCPIPSVYEGRFYALDRDDVMLDIHALHASGARHITFSDADFLNGPTHALRIAEALHGEFPELTFDFTAKVEHLLAQRSMLSRFKQLGCLFVVSAVESMCDRTLAALHKGHSAADARDLVRAFREADLTLRPTFVPFNPWDSLDDYLALLEMIEHEGLVDHVDPVQLGIRLLVPPGSLLADAAEMEPYLVSLDREGLSWRWRHPDARMDRLQREIAVATEEAARTGEDEIITFARVRHLARSAYTPACRPDPLPASTRDRVKPPRLSEHWFC